MSPDSQDTEPAAVDPSEQPAPEPKRRSGPSRLALVVTVVVVWVAVVQVLEDRTPEPTVADEKAVEAIEPPADGATNTAPGVRLEPDVVDPDWGLRYEEDLSRLDELRWTGLVEVNAEGTERPYQGKLTLVFGEGVSEAWPIIDGAVTAPVRPSQMSVLVDSGVLSVRFKNHLPVEHDFSWLTRFEPPEVLESQVGAEGAVITVRNPNIDERTVRSRAGWRDAEGWIGGDPPASALIDVELGPGETRTLTLEYAASDRGELGQPVVRTIVDPVPAP